MATPPPMEKLDTDKDLEAGGDVDRTRSMSAASRFTQAYGASMEDTPAQPPRRKKSTSSIRSHRSRSSVPGLYGGPQRPFTAETQNQESTVPSVAEELAWGPSHPCFPHINAHVPLNSPEYQSTRVIRIRRDWMVRGDLAPTFSNLYPEILDPMMPEDQFRVVIAKINETLVTAFNPYAGRNWIDSILGVLTGWVSEDIGLAGTKARLRELENWIAKWNADYGAQEGVKIIPLRRTGYTTLDIQIPDPQVRVIGEDEREDKETG